MNDFVSINDFVFNLDNLGFINCSSDLSFSNCFSFKYLTLTPAASLGGHDQHAFSLPSTYLCTVYPLPYFVGSSSVPDINTINL